MIGILGGSFDPVHNGHLGMAQTALQKFPLEKILFVPCKLHAFHKQFQTSDAHRLAMLKRAIADEPKFAMDTRELEHDAVSYTIHTLKTLQQDNPAQSFALILGMDTFTQFEKWHDWQSFINYASLIIMRRGNEPLTNLNPTLAKFVKKYQADIFIANSHHIYLVDNPLIDISSTQLRQKIMLQENILSDVPKTVAQYIAKHHLYRAESCLPETQWFTDAD